MTDLVNKDFEAAIITVPNNDSYIFTSNKKILSLNKYKFYLNF